MVRIVKKPAPLAPKTVDKPVAAPTKEQANAETVHGFEGTKAGAVSRPISGDAKSAATQGALAVQLGAKDVAPGRALALQIVPPASTKADLSGVETVQEALGLASDDELMALIRSRFTALQAEALSGTPKKLELGPQFVDIGRLVPGQTRIAIDRVQEKVGLQVQYDGFDGLTPNFDDGKATVPIEIVKPAVAGPNGKVLVIDGNHQAVGSILAGAKSVPIDIVADHQDLDEASFWKMAGEKGWLYLNEMGGAPGKIEEASYAKVENDPLRYTMSSLALKVKRLDGALTYEDSSRVEERVWVKLKGPTVDFVEFKLADVAYRAAAKDPAVAEGLKGDRATQAATARKVFADAVSAGELSPESLGILLLAEGEGLDDVEARIAKAI